MRLQTLLLFGLMPISVFAQMTMTAVVPDTSATLKGIRIESSSFDRQAGASLTFVNDYPADITAWGYCVRITPSEKDGMQNSFCKFSDALWFVIDDRIENAKRHREKGVMDCPWCHVIHAGETYTLSDPLSNRTDVADAKIILNFVAYADGNAEVLHDPELDAIINGNYQRKSTAAGRQALLKHRQELLKMAETIFSDDNNQHPAAAMIAALKRATATDIEMQGELRGFKRPEWRHGNDKEFIPEDERGYLRQFIADQQVWITELSKNQIRENQQ